MTIYKWRCPRCGYVSECYTDKAEALKDKAIHKKYCGKQDKWVSKPIEAPYPSIIDIEIWV